MKPKSIFSLLVSLIISMMCFSQTYQEVKTNRLIMSGNGVLRPLRDTIQLNPSDSGSIAFKNGKYYGWTGYFYKPISADSVIGGGGGEGIQATLLIGNQKSETIVDTNSSTGVTTWYGRPPNYNTSYGAFGRGGQFSKGWGVFNGVNSSGRPNVVGSIWRYNGFPGAGREFSDEASFDFRTETHYETAGLKLFELHLPEFTDTAGISHRIFSWYIDKTGKAGASPALEGNGMAFLKWNDQSTTWGSLTNLGRLDIKNVVQNTPSYPGFTFGSLADSVAGIPWASGKWDFKLDVRGQYAVMGRESLVAADNATLNIVDNIQLGGSGLANRRSLIAYGTNSFSQGENFFDNAGVGNFPLAVYYNGVRRLEVGNTYFHVYNTIYAGSDIQATTKVKIGDPLAGSYADGAILDVVSTDKGVIFPRMTASQRNAISPIAVGLMVFDTDSSATFEYTSSGWRQIRGNSNIYNANGSIPKTTTRDVLIDRNSAINFKDTNNVNLTYISNDLVYLQKKAKGVGYSSLELTKSLSDSVGQTTLATSATILGVSKLSNYFAVGGYTKISATDSLILEGGMIRLNGPIHKAEFDKTITSSGTTGAQTINKIAGTVNIAAAGTTVTVTNSLVTVNSIVICTLRTNDATATIKNVVPAAGSFVINLGAASTGEVSIGFFVVN